MSEMNEKSEQNTLQNIIAAKQRELQIHQFGLTTTDQLVIHQEVRDLCETNSCGRYGGRWVCPPAVGTVEECRQRIFRYRNVFVYSTKHDIEDSYDFEGMMAGQTSHEMINRNVITCFRVLVGSDLLILSGGGCNRCPVCTYPDAPCRFPDKVYPAVESYGMEVYRLAQTVGINYINGENTVTYFSCIMF
ncbi:MAG: DUF2284 domain-containing protein [Clostridiales bacterium]|nr:DUF2284 domain-containing protein [Clostridiales bacterium]